MSKYTTDGFLGMFIDETTEMVKLPKDEFLRLCWNMDLKTGSESKFLYYHMFAYDTEVNVAKLVYEELLKYDI